MDWAVWAYEQQNICQVLFRINMSSQGRLENYHLRIKLTQPNLSWKYGNSLWVNSNVPDYPKKIIQPNKFNQNVLGEKRVERMRWERRVSKKNIS